jgi:hypothetical protein
MSSACGLLGTLSVLVGGRALIITAAVRYRSGGRRRGARWVTRAEGPVMFWTSVLLRACLGTVFAAAGVFLFGLIARWWELA